MTPTLRRSILTACFVVAAATGRTFAEHESAQQKSAEQGSAQRPTNTDDGANGKKANGKKANGKKANGKKATSSPSKSDSGQPATRNSQGDTTGDRRSQQAESARRRRRTVPPWARKSSPRAELPVQPFGHARELLKRYDIDASSLGYLHDKQPLTADDEDTLIRVLYHVPRFRLDDIQRWSSSEVPWQSLLQKPEIHRADYFELRGRVVRVEKAPLIKELAELLQFDHYYRVRFLAEGSSHPLLLCARQVPRAWKADVDMNEPATANAMFMKLGAETKLGQELVFVTRRLRWHPRETNEDLGVDEDAVRLARLGMDIGLFDELANRHGQSVGSPERECFYRLLAALRNPRAERELPRTPQPINLTELLLRPAENEGKSLVLEGTLRRLTPIDVNDEDINAAFDIDAYYQLDAFVSLGKRSIRLGRQDDPDAPVFEGQFPVTICVAKLPPELQAIADQQLKDGERNRMLNEVIYVKGVFFKVWSYHTQFVDSSSSTNRQVSPMIIAYSIEMEQPERRGPLTGLAVGIVFILVLGATWFYVWRNSRKDDDTLHRLRKRTRPDVKF